MGRKWKFSRRRTDSKSSNQNSFKKNNQFPSSPTFVIKKGKGNRDHRLKIKKKATAKKKRIDCNHLSAKEKHRVLVKVIPLGREKGRKMVKFRVVSPTNVTSPAGHRPPFKRSPTVKPERGSCVRYDGMNEWTPRKGRLHSILFFFWGGGESPDRTSRVDRRRVGRWFWNVTTDVRDARDAWFPRHQRFPATGRARVEEKKNARQVPWDIESVTRPAIHIFFYRKERCESPSPVKTAKTG